MNAPAITRPIVRYHGGKFLLANWIISHFPPHRVYVEPFGGGGSVLLRKPRSYAEVYNDMDGEIVNVFRMVRDRGDELLRVLVAGGYGAARPMHNLGGGVVAVWGTGTFGHGVSLSAISPR